MSMFDDRRRDEQAANDKEYKRRTDAWEQGHEDGATGLPDRGHEYGSDEDAYGSGYEEGAKERAALEAE